MPAPASSRELLPRTRAWQQSLIYDLFAGVLVLHGAVCGVHDRPGSGPVEVATLCTEASGRDTTARQSTGVCCLWLVCAQAVTLTLVDTLVDTLVAA